jgi:hypothetical protein
MKPLGLAVAASLLTIVALGPRRTDLRTTSGGHAPNAARSLFSRHNAAILAQNDQMNMQQENSGSNADTGDQSPPDDQSVDTETGDSAEPEAAAPEADNPGTAEPEAEPPDAAQPGYSGADAGKDASDYESEDDETDSDNSSNLMNNEGGFSANQDQPPGAQP